MYFRRDAAVHAVMYPMARSSVPVWKVIMATPAATVSVASPSSGARLQAVRLAQFSTLAVPIAAAQMPLNVYLPAIYA